MENFRCEVFSSNIGLLKKLRTTIQKARIVFKKETIDGLLTLIDDFGVYYGDVWKKEEYQEIFNDVQNEGDGYKKKLYYEIIMPQKIETIEKILENYLELPQ